MAALGGAAVGGAVGGIAGVLIGLGIPEYEAKRYEGKIKGGNALISVHTDDSDEARRAKEIFKRAGADDISRAPANQRRPRGKNPTRSSTRFLEPLRLIRLRAASCDAGPETAVQNGQTARRHVIPAADLQRITIFRKRTSRWQPRT